MSLRVSTYRGAEIAAYLDPLAQLRIGVFRDWPYLYEGDAAYERRYLASYAREGAVLVAVWDGDRMVGASTGMPLSHHVDNFGDTFSAQPDRLKDAFYCAESVLLPDYRGRGLGHRFFDEREAVARHDGFQYATFCAVMRPDDHPLRPLGHRPLDPFWRTRGYAPLPGVVARFSWRDIGADGETEKPLQFWIKRL